MSSKAHRQSPISGEPAAKSGRRRRSASRRTANTRNAILDAAVSLYQTQGIENTSIGAVIEKSAVGRTTFYRHFSDRDDVLNQALKRDFESLMEDFAGAARRYDSLEVQIEEDMIWFLDQFAHRPALSLLFTNIDWREYQQTYRSIDSFRQASIACVRPTYERARKEGRLREGVTMQRYIDWASFVVVAMQVVDVPSIKSRVQSREMLRSFLVPSLITDPA